MIRTIVVSLLLGVFVVGSGNPAFDEPRRAKLPVGPATRRATRQSQPKRRPDPNELHLALERALGPGEEVALTAQGVGSTLVLTNKRLLVVREGASFRPSSGIRAWHLDRELRVRLGRAYRQTHRLAIGDASMTASVFISADDAADAQRLIAEARLRSFAGDETD
jgi:hypothetical protein